MMRSLSGLVPFLFVIAGSVGCTAPPAPESVGSLVIALTAPGAGGATYRLPSGSFLLLIGPTFGGQFSLDDDAASVTLQVPPGDYSVRLFDSSGDTTVWPLQRQNADGTIETVPGTLDLTPTISVVKDQTTPLVIRFHLAGSAITFSLGSVDVSVDVDETSSSLDIVLSVSALIATAVSIGDTAPAELPSRLPALNSTGDQYTLTTHTVGSWFIAQPNQVCIQTTGSSIDAGGNSGFIEFIAEAPPTGNEHLCLTQVTPNVASLFIAFDRQGPATTPLLSDLSDREFIVDQFISASFFAAVFDGTTLHLDALSGARSASMLVGGAIFEGPSFEGWYGLNEAGDGTATFILH